MVGKHILPGVRYGSRFGAGMESGTVHMLNRYSVTEAHLFVLSFDLGDWKETRETG